MKNNEPWDDGTKKRLLEAAGEIFAQNGEAFVLPQSERSASAPMPA